MAMQIPGDDQRRTTVLPPLNRLSFWLATVQPDRIADEGIRAKVIAYQEECADMLFAHFFTVPGVRSEVPAAASQ